MNGFTEQDVPDQTGKCFIVTGANAGIGFEISKALASKGARVLLACRDKSKADDAIARIRSLTPSADLAYLPLDQSDLDSIRTAAEQVQKEPRLDALINNAGVMYPPLMRTKQGFELQFGVNYLGTFALTSLLLAKLSQTPESRVVITGSIAHLKGAIDWDDLNSEKSYNKDQRYSASKLADLLFLYELDKRLRAVNSSVTAVGCHPGFATTELGRHMGLIAQLLTPLIKLAKILNTPAMGAWPALQAATGKIKPGGYYGPTQLDGKRGPSGESSRAPQAQDDVLSKRLWDTSVKLTGVDPDLAFLK